jgi:hypothetical protein
MMCAGHSGALGLPAAPGPARLTGMSSVRSCMRHNFGRRLCGRGPLPIVESTFHYMCKGMSCRLVARPAAA